jgi:hypothetical protein
MNIENKSMLYQSVDRNSHSLAKLIQKYGDQTIKSITVCRVPLSKAIQLVGNIISVNGLEAAKKQLGYDNIFHLYLYIELHNNQHFTLEKNELIRVYYGRDDRKRAETMPVYINKLIDLNSFFENGIKLDPQGFFIYNIQKNNCQNFCILLLNGSHLLTPALQTFILQNAESIIEHLPPKLTWFSNQLVSLYAKIQRLRGLGIHI